MDTGPSRKRLRRSTRSCYQCRKRKVKCQLTEESVETCAECIKSGTPCTLQAPRAEMGNPSPTVLDDRQEHDARLERIEALLKKLVDAQEPSTRSGEILYEPQPAIPTSFWDDILLSPSSNPPLPAQPENTLDPKQSLVALLPSVNDAATIVTNTTAWLWGAENPPGSVLVPNDTVQLLETAAISRGNVIHVAKSLLLFALYMQQLPANFDVQFLESQSVDGAISLIMERVQQFMFSHEDAATSLDSLECLTLLSLLQLNDGSIRKAWLTNRRTLDVARLKGLQNSFSLATRNSTSGDMALRRRLWLSTISSDCYCSLLLGLEPGLGISPFGPEDATWTDPLADEHANIQRRLCLIIARIAQRNAIGLYQDRQTLQEIDESLNQLRDSIPPSWWRAPSFRRDRPLDSATEPNRLICQLWFYQARMLAHMPIAFGRAADGCSSSLESCIEASRITLHRYIGLQHARDQLSRCRSVDQSAFLAAVVLLLGRVQLQNCNTMSSRCGSDQALLEQVVESFESVGATCSRERVARQSSDILSAMMEIAAGNVLPAASITSRHSNSRSQDKFQEIAREEDSSETIRYRMEDVIVSCIQPAIDRESPASRVLNQTLKRVVGRE